MDLKYFTNQGEGVYELSLKGVVGEELNGDYIAAEIDFLNTIGAKVIRERINSVGGGIINGFSIIESNLNSKAEIHTINGGMAGSIMSAVLASGTPGKRFAIDYSTAVIHDPSYDGVTLADIKDEKKKSELTKFKESIVQIYASNTKMTKSLARKMMTEDRMLNSEEQKEYGLIDEILPSKMKPAITKNMSYSDIMNVCDDESKFINNIETPKINKMSELSKFYNLSDDATPDSILREAQKDRSNLQLAENRIKAFEKTEAEKLTEMQNLKAEVDKYKNKAIESAVLSAIESGKFLEENKESLIENAKNVGLEAFNLFVENMPVKAVNVLSKLTNQDSSVISEKKSKEQRLGEEWQDLITNNKAEALRISREEPAKYEEYVNAFNNIK